MGEVFLCACLVLPHPLAPICGLSASSLSCFTEVPAGSCSFAPDLCPAARAPSGCRGRLWLVSLCCCQLLESLDLPRVLGSFPPTQYHPLQASCLLCCCSSIFLQVWARHPPNAGCPTPGHGRQGKFGALQVLNQKDASEDAHIAALVHRVLLGLMESLLTQSS